MNVLKHSSVYVQITFAGYSALEMNVLLIITVIQNMKMAKS